VVLADLVDLQHQAATALSIRSATSTGEASSGTVTAQILWGTRESIMFRDTPVYQPMPGVLSTVAEASRPARRRWTCTSNVTGPRSPCSGRACSGRTRTTGPVSGEIVSRWGTFLIQS